MNGLNKTMEISEEAFNKLKAFVVKQSAVTDEEICRTTEIENGLGITGDDAVEFMVAFGKEFNVDVTRFMAADYFEAEGDKILPTLIRFLTGRKKKAKKILTVGHLEKGILAGRLDEEIINN